ncbi:uncharacterized protein B0T23DRAFT_389119 [Neurospora hispaniola]|uniref:Uncharacterized protein n=1 Tax=Neurospora hispaniola TaxID=588809 RepID=A0AAJ0I024_9PEZI|nr:hypothetical protein B0T23DRAFT_389119 [Neurospora hispaniola]
MSRIFVGFCQLSYLRGGTGVSDSAVSVCHNEQLRGQKLQFCWGFFTGFFKVLPHNQAPTPRNNELSPVQAGRPVWKWIAWHACL